MLEVLLIFPVYLKSILLFLMLLLALLLLLETVSAHSDWLMHPIILEPKFLIVFCVVWYIASLFPYQNFSWKGKMIVCNVDLSRFWSCLEISTVDLAVQLKIYLQTKYTNSASHDILIFRNSKKIIQCSKFQLERENDSYLHREFG